MLGVLSPFLFGLASLAFSYVLVSRLGGQTFAIALAGLFLGGLYAYVSFRSLLVPLLAWILAVGGLRYLYAIQAPILPDLYLDRMTLIWLALIFMVKVVVERRALRRPYLVDALLIVYASYLLFSIFQNGMGAFHVWTMSTMIPYLAYFFAKNIVNSDRAVNWVLGALLALSIYYNVDAVAEKYNVTALIWPKVILSAKNEFAGRSLGPFLHAPVFGTVIGMLLPIHLYFIQRARRLLFRSLLFVSLGVGFAGLYFTYTRGSWLAGLAAMGVAAFFNRRHYLRILLPLAVVLPIVAVLFLGIAQDQFMKERLENEDTVGYRLATGVIVARMWRDHPLTGVGYFQYKAQKMNYTNPVDLPLIGTVDSNALRASVIHDIYLGPTGEGGLIGAVLQFSIYFLILRNTWRRLSNRDRKGDFNRLVVPLLAGILMGYFVGGLAIDYRYFSIMGALFFFAAGMVDGYEGGYEKHEPA